MREFNPNYTTEERDAQVAWFDQHIDQLPQEMQINAATRTSNLPNTVRALLNTIRANQPAVTFAGYFETLLQIRDRLEEQGIK